MCKVNHSKTVCRLFTQWIEPNSRTIGNYCLLHGYPPPKTLDIDISNNGGYYHGFIIKHWQGLLGNTTLKHTILCCPKHYQLIARLVQRTPLIPTDIKPLTSVWVMVHPLWWIPSFFTSQYMAQNQDWEINNRFRHEFRLAMYYSEQPIFILFYVQSRKSPKTLALQNLEMSFNGTSGRKYKWVDLGEISRKKLYFRWGKGPFKLLLMMKFRTKLNLK